MSHSVSARQSPHRWATAIRNNTDFGIDLEYDNAWLALMQAAQGKPETQFEPAIPPDWVGVMNQSEKLLDESRDLRLVALWAEAALRLHGLHSLPESLHILCDMMESGWNFIFPALDPDDADPYARINVIEGLGRGGSFYQSVRESRIFEIPAVGVVNIRALEALLDAASYPDTHIQFSREQVHQYLIEQPALLGTLHQLIEETKVALQRCGNLLNSLAQGHQASSLADLAGLLGRLGQVLPPPVTDSEIAPEPVASVTSTTVAPADFPRTATPDSSWVPGGIQSRRQALRAIDEICIYLENAEPTNPAQLLLKRARRLIDKNFLELVKDLAPDALVEVARIMGVDPEDLQAGSQ